MLVDLDEPERGGSYSDEGELDESYNDEYELRESSDKEPSSSVEAESHPNLGSDAEACERGCVKLGRAQVDSIFMGLKSILTVGAAEDLFLRAAFNLSKGDLCD